MVGEKNCGFCGGEGVQRSSQREEIEREREQASNIQRIPQEKKKKNNTSPILLTWKMRRADYGVFITSRVQKN